MINLHCLFLESFSSSGSLLDFCSSAIRRRHSRLDSLPFGLGSLNSGGRTANCGFFSSKQNNRNGETQLHDLIAEELQSKMDRDHRKLKKCVGKVTVN